MTKEKIKYSISETYLNPPRNTVADWKITDLENDKIVLMARSRIVTIDDICCLEVYSCTFKSKDMVWIYINHLLLIYGGLMTIVIPAELYTLIPRLRVLGFKRQKDSPHYARVPEQAS